MRFHEHFTQEELDILRSRAERLALTNTEVSRIEYPALRVTIGHESYALPMVTLASVYQGVSVIPVPCTPAHILGVANVRGRIIPILRLAYLLNVTSVETETYIIVVSHKDTLVGMSVTRVSDILNYADTDVIALTETHRWIKGMLNDGTPLLDLDVLLGDPSLIVQDTPYA
jgi:purine-binding chemotaxis protein CheW